MGRKVKAGHYEGSKKLPGVFIHCRRDMPWLRPLLEEISEAEGETIASLMVKSFCEQYGPRYPRLREKWEAFKKTSEV